MATAAAAKRNFIEERLLTGPNAGQCEIVRRHGDQGDALHDARACAVQRWRRSYGRLWCLRRAAGSGMHRCRHRLQRPTRRRWCAGAGWMQTTRGAATRMPKPTLAPSALQMRDIGRQLGCSAVPGNADAANAQAAGALTLDQRRGDRPVRINWPRSADDRNRVRRYAGQSPTHLHGRAHSRVAATACARH